MTYSLLSGLISGYSSERESLEEQVQNLEEEKEALSSELESARSRLQEFTQATGELEARRQDVELQRTLLQENSGQEAQGSNPRPPSVVAWRLDRLNAPDPPDAHNNYAYLVVPIGVFVGAYLFREWIRGV